MWVRDFVVGIAKRGNVIGPVAPSFDDFIIILAKAEKVIHMLFTEQG